MEINATNEVRSTETENATHDTWFRLSLDLHTPHDRGGSNPDSNLSFSGTTPEAFDHALATILDVVTSTVYGGQLNGLQEIIDHDTEELRASSEKVPNVSEAFKDCKLELEMTPEGKPLRGVLIKKQPSTNPALGVTTPKIPTVTEPRPSFAPPSKPSARGAKGLMLLTCPGCKHTFKHFARENTDKVKCFCGTEVPVDNVTRFEFTCKKCGKLSYGWTNIESAVIEAGALNCVCLEPAPEMLWNPATRKFRG